MSLEKTPIDICIGTCQRPEMLKELLQSLENQVSIENFIIRIIIVDNDTDKSAYPIVEAHQRLSSFQIDYDMEPEKGISFVRNRAIRKVSANYFAFIDDDETVAENWLATMYKAMIEHQADVVFGPVVSLLPDNAPTWARTNPCFKTKRFGTGTLLKTGATNNVMIRTRALDEPRDEFDPTFALTGGSDTEFFYRLYCSGKKLIACDEAIVYEKIPQNRLTEKWILLRSFRKGQGYSRIFVRKYSVARKLFWGFSKSIQIFWCLASMLFVRAWSIDAYFLLKYKIYSKFGQLTGIFGKHFLYKEYDLNKNKRLSRKKGVPRKS
jgi:glycosyltransferase involved in cell wall biosynthesis